MKRPKPTLFCTMDPAMDGFFRISEKTSSELIFTRMTVRKNWGNSISLTAGPLQRGGGLGGFSPPVFGKTVNPISTRGTSYAHHNTMSPHGFSDLATDLDGNKIKQLLHSTSEINS